MPIPLGQILWVIAGSALTLVLAAAIAFWTINHARSREQAGRESGGK